MPSDPFWQGMKSSGYRTCRVCGYPYPASEKGCRNPACYANPKFTPKQRSEMRAAAAERERQKEERAKLDRARKMSFEYRSK